MPEQVSADLKAVLSSVESGLADIAETLGNLGERFDPAAVEQAMADILEALAASKGADLTPLVAAIKAMPAPVVQVNVPPVDLSHIESLLLERRGPRKWTVTLHGDNYTPDRRMTIEA